MHHDRPTSAEYGAVVVCGAGAAGLAAALAASRAGANVYLLEARRRLGGTVTHSLIHTLGGLYDSTGEILNGGLAQELSEVLRQSDSVVCRRRIGRAWVLAVSPETYQRVVARWVEAEPRITVLLNTRVSGATRKGDRIVEIEAGAPEGAVTLRCQAVVDVTGTGEVVRLVDRALVEDDPMRSGAGLIFTLRGVAPGTMAFPKGLSVVRALHAAAAAGALPPHCGKAWLDTGVYDDEVYVKLLVPLPAAREALSDQAAVVSFMRRLPGFARAVVSHTGDLGIRDGGRIRGEYCLTAEDVRQARKFEDAACRCCWPIEYWDPNEGVSLEYLPDNEYYEIPMRSLKVKGLQNVFAAGKCLSADRYAQASARVVGTCWSMGEAAGKAAAGHSRLAGVRGRSGLPDGTWQQR